MLAAAITHPLSGEESTATWVERLYDGELEHTVLTALGVHGAWLAMLPVLTAAGAAAALAAAATPQLRVGALRGPLALLFGWVALAVVGPTLAGDLVTPLSGGGRTLVLIAAGALTAALTLGVIRYRERRTESAAPGIAVRVPALGDRIS
jgi:hypothetical protein